MHQRKDIKITKPILQNRTGFNIIIRKQIAYMVTGNCLNIPSTTFGNSSIVF
jgi:hypothetical protein